LNSWLKGEKLSGSEVYFLSYLSEFKVLLFGIWCGTESVDRSQRLESATAASVSAFVAIMLIKIAIKQEEGKSFKATLCWWQLLAEPDEMVK
jgi:hypothetical protein